MNDALDTNQQLAALRARYRRQRAWLLVGLLGATAAVSSAAGIPGQLLRLTLRAGPPGPLAIVPRHVPWSGVLEFDGGLVNDPALPMVLSLRGADGGVQWTESITTAVSGGRFTVELGETNPIPQAALATNFLDLDVRVGAAMTQLPRQRVLSVPFALRTGDVITAARTFNIGPAGDFATLADAFAWLQPRAVRGQVILQLLDGTHALPAAGLRYEHVDGTRILLRGNLTDPTQVVVTAAGQGLTIASPIELVRGFRLVGSGGAGTVGLHFTRHATSSLQGVHVEGFETPLRLSEGSAFYYVDVRLTGLGPHSGVCFDLREGSHVNGANLNIASCQVGIRTSERSSFSVSGGSITNVAEGAHATRSSYIAFEALPFQIADAGVGQRASLHSALASAPTVTYVNVTTERDPPSYVLGNGNSYVLP